MKHDRDEAIDHGRRAFLRGDALRRSAKEDAAPNGIVPLAGPAAIDRSACIAWNGVVCMSCRFACSAGAIVAGAASLLWLASPTLRTAGLLAVLVWASCRFYYFLFYVLETYVDPRLRYAGLRSLAAAAWRHRRSSPKPSDPRQE